MKKNVIFSFRLFYEFLSVINLISAASEELSNEES